MDYRPSSENFHQALECMDLEVIFAAEIAHDSGKLSDKGGYEFTIVQCEDNLTHHQDLQKRGIFKQLPKDKLSEMIPFHNEVVKPLVRFFTYETQTGAPEDNVPLEDRYTAFYYLQYACNLAARYKTDENNVEKDFHMRGVSPSVKIKMLEKIPNTFCGPNGRLALQHVVAWVKNRYEKLLVEARTSCSGTTQMGPNNSLLNILVVDGLKNFQQRISKDKLEQDEVVKASEHWASGRVDQELFVIDRLETCLK
ncbi:uncharacterized protein Triagg1_44 [Trichoderma aggressivum f. europaeum]|uniref:Uncharacterized protein n=1 Tax=Trichoderma aggressivum f. europaeum TaxID=173218 RepID=A0AAE1JF08_9HYPO|nr:hypothetical protein Triagg1_44 [Trichoderma aggressivum f. europaeum]